MKQKGFTLIELMVAISIVAVLAAVGLVVYSSAEKIARDSRVKQDMEEVKKAMYVYQSQAGNFCLGVSCGFSIWVNYGSYGAPYNTAVDNLKNNLVRKTMYDPYIGLRVVSANEFYLFSSLENPPATSCIYLDRAADWYFTGTDPMNYCLGSN